MTLWIQDPLPGMEELECPVCRTRHVPVGGGLGTVPAFACPGDFADRESCD